MISTKFNKRNLLGICFDDHFLFIFMVIPNNDFNLKKRIALADVAQWIECWPVNQRGTGLIPRQGTCLGCGPGPHWELREKQLHIDDSLSLSPALPLFLRVNK